MKKIISIGDLHGNYKAFELNLLNAGIIDIDYNWLQSNIIVIFHGDILADRYSNGFDILVVINTLRKKAIEYGSEIYVIAGNHDDFMISYLTNRDGIHGNGIDISDIGYYGNRQGEGLWELEEFGSVIPNNHKNIVDKMKNNEKGKIILDEICSMLLVKRINDTLFIHTNPTDTLLDRLLEKDNNLNIFITKINTIWGNFLENKLLLDCNLDIDNDLFDSFLYTNNRINSNHKNQYQKLKQSGINTIIHGHSGGKGLTKEYFGIKVIDTDYSFGKGGMEGKGSFTLIDENNNIHLLK